MRQAPIHSPCPTPDELAECLEPLAPEDEQLVSHLENCESCRQTLDWLAGQESWWRAASDSLHPDANSAPDQTIATRLVESVCALSASPTTETAAPLQDHELAQLRALLEPACHPELLGRIGRYELEQLVGRGGMGLVFRGYDTELHRVVAVKTLAVHLIPVAAARQRFIREARASASLVHPHIVPVHDVITEGPVPAIVMQYIAGPTLEDHLREVGALPWRDCLQLAIQLTDALSLAHDLDLVHRDIKPGNVLLEADASRALLTDFGLVRALDDATLTHSSMLAGTPDYMSPEQARGRAVAQSSDLFSMGSLLVAMLTGEPPFRAPDPMATMNRLCHEPHVPLTQRVPEAPPELSALIDRLLDKDPKQRPSSSAEVCRALQQQLRSPPAGRANVFRAARWHSMTRWAPTRRLPDRRWRDLVTWPVGAALVLLVLSTWGGVHLATTAGWGNSSPHVAGNRADPSSGDPSNSAPVTTPVIPTSPAEYRLMFEEMGLIDAVRLDVEIQQIRQQADSLLQQQPAPSSTADVFTTPTAIDRELWQLNNSLNRIEMEIQSALDTTP